MVLVVLIHHTIHIAKTEADTVEILDSSYISWVDSVSLLQPRNSLSVDKVNLCILSLVLVVADAGVAVQNVNSIVSLLDDKVAEVEVCIESLWTKLCAS